MVTPDMQVCPIGRPTMTLITGYAHASVDAMHAVAPLICRQLPDLKAKWLHEEATSGGRSDS